MPAYSGIRGRLLQMAVQHLLISYHILDTVTSLTKMLHSVLLLGLNHEKRALSAFWK